MASSAKRNATQCCLNKRQPILTSELGAPTSTPQLLNPAALRQSIVSEHSGCTSGSVTSQLLHRIVKEIASSSEKSVFACSAVSSTSGGRTFAHAGSFV